MSSILKSWHDDCQREIQLLENSWSDFNEKMEKRLAEMEKQVKSKEWEELKNGTK